jgi:hypothetical protein
MTPARLACKSAPSLAGAEGPTVVAALQSCDAVTVATSAIGRRALRLANAGDLTGALDQESARALLFELGHPAFTELCTRLSAVGTRLPVVVLLPAGRLPARELLTLGSLASVFVAHDPQELARELRRAIEYGGVASDSHDIARMLVGELPSEAAVIGMGLYVTGTRNASVTQATERLGYGALRNRLRALGLARASTILGWACAIGVVWRIENEGCSLAEAARAAGFDTTRQFSDRVLYHTGRSPTALCDEYGFASLAREFVEVVSTRVFSVA